ncbi:hypothetical protein FNA46_20225 [Rhizobium straminoryzae]|uniref:Uncharacterized protein n=2 Tax=Rhizobium straminoryzae TaxID=1387186 RepID=A0A549T0Y2_9HYPH|nr:hypothetical protein FNA46_20225 [Rhizobium straminoryzae]
MSDFYERIWREPGALGETLRSSVRMISSVYELNQSQNFGTSLLFTLEQDPIVAFNEETSSIITQGRVATHAVELMREVNFGKLTVTDIGEIRDESENDLFTQAKKFRREALINKDITSVERLSNFLRQEYVPHILKRAPHARRAPIESTSRSAVDWIGKAGAASTVLSLVVGNRIGIGIFEPAYQHTMDIITVLGLTGLATEKAYKRVGEADRFFFNDPSHKAALLQLQREFSIIDSYR